jgi:hypothetical protein
MTASSNRDLELRSELRQQLKKLSNRHRAFRYRAFKRWKESSAKAPCMSPQELLQEREQLKTRLEPLYIQEKANLLKTWTNCNSSQSRSKELPLILQG